MRYKTKHLKKDLKEYFGYNEFKGVQEQVISRICQRKDILAIMPTGAGKSLCFQLSALQFDGITLVISPLNALMKDQCENFNAAMEKKGRSERAVYINSERKKEEIEADLKNENYLVKLIYLSPERLFYNSFRRFIFRQDKTIDMIVVDEAHCVSLWGYDFRETYSMIPEFIYGLRRRPIIAAFTATAVKPVVADMIELLQLNFEMNKDDPRRSKGVVIADTSNDESRFTFSVIKCDTVSERKNRLSAYLSEHPDELGIVFCATIKNVEDVCAYLIQNGFHAVKYHGFKNTDSNEMDLDQVEERDKVLADALASELEKLNKEHAETLHKFQNDESLQCVVATGAFGMGIDKKKGKDVTYIIHYDLPLNLENYCQEIGRGGRKNGRCNCIIYRTKQSIELLKHGFIEKMGENSSPLLRDYVQKMAEKRLEEIKKFVDKCKTQESYTAFIREYFESFDPILPDNPIRPIFFYNNTHLVRELRKRKKRREGSFSERTKNDSIKTSYKISSDNGEELSYFDLMVLDAIYSIKRSGMYSFSTHTVLQTLAGYDKTAVKSAVRGDIEKSIEQLQRLTIDYERNGKSIKGEKLLCNLHTGKIRNGEVFLPIPAKENQNLPESDFLEMSFLFRHASNSANGQFLSIPFSEINMRSKEEKKRIVPITKEWLQIQHYIITRVLYSRNMKQIGKHYNSRISFDTMINDLDLLAYVDRNGKTQEKRILMRIIEILNCLVEYGYISEYQFYEYDTDDWELIKGKNSYYKRNNSMYDNIEHGLYQYDEKNKKAMIYAGIKYYL